MPDRRYVASRCRGTARSPLCLQGLQVLVGGTQSQSVLLARGTVFALTVFVSPTVLHDIVVGEYSVISFTTEKRLRCRTCPVPLTTLFVDQCAETTPLEPRVKGALTRSA